jgi:hypothetical protein
MDIVNAKQTMITSDIDKIQLSFIQENLFVLFQNSVFWLYFYFSHHCTMSLEKISCQEVVGEEEMGSPSNTQVSLLLHHYNLVSIDVIRNSAKVCFSQVICRYKQTFTIKASRYTNRHSRLANLLGLFSKL